jgi:hypothetical protein
MSMGHKPAGRHHRDIGCAKRIASEPGFAATDSWLGDVVPQLSSYPVQQSYR